LREEEEEDYQVTATATLLTVQVEAEAEAELLLESTCVTRKATTVEEHLQEVTV